MNNRIIKRLSIITAALLLLLTFVSCGEEPQTRDIATSDSVSAAVRQTQAALTEAPTQPPTELPTQSPTQPFVPKVIDDLQSDPSDIYDATGFIAVSDVIPDLREDIRYYSDYNFVGERIDGYEEPLAILSKEATKALNDAADDFRGMGYGIVIYDAYRPQSAVNHFASWANDYSDTRMKAEFYPDVDKSLLYDYGFIAYQSGHSRGSTVDISLYDLESGEELDMGGGFDYFSEVSHPDYGGVTSEQYQNRMTLRSVMEQNGFEGISSEWWHFSLSYEPYPYTYFDFPVSRSSLNE